MPALAKWPNSDLAKGFAVPQVAQKHDWPEPMVWSQALKGMDPLLYAAKKAIGPSQLTEEEARNTGRRAYIRNSSLSSKDIGKSIGRSRQAVDDYIADLRAATQMDKSFKIFRMNRLGIPQDRIAKRLGMDQKTIHYHLGEMAALPNLLNADLSQGFTVSQVAQKHGWTEPMVWSLALEEKDDLKKFKELGWIKRPSSSLAIAMTALTGRGRLQRTD
jgi:hypothetical protein